MNDPAAPYFSCSEKERAIFESGVKLGAIYHQYIGIPVNEENVEFVERTIEKAVSVQPFVESVSVNIDKRKIGKARTAYRYKTLTGDMIDAKVIIRYGKARVEGRIAWVPSMKYPLMRFRVLDE
ncbi:MAG: dihydroneopterin aldolase family protein [Thermoplasmatales archaeon]